MPTRPLRCTRPPTRQAHGLGTVAGRRKAVIIIGVLVAVSVLTYLAYSYADMTGTEYKATVNTARATQARLAAESGIHYVMALLSDPANLADPSIFGNAALFQNQAVNAGDDPNMRGRFSIHALNYDDGQGSRYAAGDEAGKLNLNALMQMDKTGKILYDMLLKLPNMTEEIADAIVDWLDADDTPRTNGAESAYYLGLNPPYRAKNGPLDSIDELLLVKGVTPQLLFGNDKNRNGKLDPGEDDGSGAVDLGWAAYLTVFSRVENKDITGNPRIYLNEADVATLWDKVSTDLHEELAIYIALYRQYGPYKKKTTGTLGVYYDLASGAQLLSGNAMALDSTGQVLGVTSSVDAPVTLYFVQATGSSSTAPPGNTTALTKGAVNTKTKAANSIGSMCDLVNSYVEIKSSNPKQPSTYYASPLNDAAKLKELMPILFDKTTISKDTEFRGLININTAPEAVLRTLQGLSEENVQAILAARPAPGTAADAIFQTPAWLITEAGLAPETVKALEKYVTTRSQVYRIQSMGYLEGGGPTVRIEAVIDAGTIDSTTGRSRPRIVHWRDLTELGKGFETTQSGSSN